jgi:hypothetical protein
MDAFQLATFVLAREKIEGLELVTVDDRLQTAHERVYLKITSAAWLWPNLNHSF